MGKVLGFEDAELVVLAVTLEHLALNVYTTGFAHYGGCHPGACTVGKSIDGYMTGNAIEKHRKKESTGKKQQTVVKGKR